MKRNKYLMTCPAMRDGYIQWVHPLTIQPHEQYRMFGDHGNFCPVKFEEVSKPDVQKFSFAKFPSLGYFTPVKFFEVVCHG